MRKKDEKKIGKSENFFEKYSFGLVRRMYDWVLSWGNSKYASVALFVLAFIEASFFIIPPDVLLLSLSVAKPKKSFWYGTICTLGSVIGSIFGWFIGFALYESVGKAIIETFHYQQYFTMVGQMYQQNAFWFIFTAALTPIPYKVFTIAAGVWGISIPTLILASILGRGLRFYGESAMIYFFGPKIKKFIDKYFNWITIAALVLLIGGFFAIKYLI